MLLEGAELAVGQLEAEAAGAAVRKEGDALILEAEDLGDALRAGAGADFDDFAFAKVVAAAVGAELGDLVGEAGEGAGAELFEAKLEGFSRAIVADVGGIFAMQRPIFWDAQSGADGGRSAFGGDEGANLGIDVAALAH